MKRTAVAIAGLVMALGGCASVHPVKVAQAAPVTHKLGEGGYDYASVRPVAPNYRLPETVIRPSTPKAEPKAEPRAARPAPRAVEAPRIPAPQPLVPEVAERFDPRSVDKELYAHQRVGKRYTVFGKSYTPRHQPEYDVTGVASWYGPKFHGKPTASGETFDMNGLSAAHKTLPLNSLVHVENLSNGRSLVLRVNDRGPFVGDRIIDLSKAAADQLGLLEHGLKDVRVRYAGPADPNEIPGAKRRPEPRPAPRPEPEAVVEAPQTRPKPLSGPETVALPETYTPLRKLPEGAAPRSVAAPVLPEVPSAPVLNAPSPAQPAPVFEALPEVRPEAHEGPLTLTIKGPIHLAKSQRLPNPDYVRAASSTRAND